MSIWVVRVWRLDRNPQTEKDDEATENVSSRLQAIRNQSKRVTHESSSNLCNRQAKIYEYSEKRGSRASFRDPFRHSIRTCHVLTILRGCDLYCARELRQCMKVQTFNNRLTIPRTSYRNIVSQSARVKNVKVLLGQCLADPKLRVIQQTLAIGNPQALVISLQLNPYEILVSAVADTVI